MYNFMHLVFIVSALVNLKDITGLNETTRVEDNEILRTKSIIRNATNKIFTSLKLKGINDNPIIKHYSIIHSYFVSLTLQDHNNLKQIANLSRVDKKINYNKTYYNRFYDNRTAAFIDQVIEILNGDSNTSQSNVSADIVFPVFNYTHYIVNYINGQLKELDHYLQIFNSDGTNRSGLDINKDILAVLNNKAQALNGTHNIEDIFENFECRSFNETEEKDLFAKGSDTWMDPRLSGRRIFNGKRTKIKRFPFMASIEIFKKFTCGGSIISADLIITAASCLQLAWNNRFYRENPAFIQVRVGSNYYGGGGEEISVLEVYFHPSYNPQTLSNNIAIVRLHKQIRFKNRNKSNIKMIAIDRRASPLPMNVDGITIVGWGAKTIKNIVHGTWANKLSYAVLDVYSLQECQDIYSKEYVRNTNFCAGFISKGTGACNRDVGGPGLVAGTLTGIISFGAATCGSPNSPTVFTKVGYYAKWIDQIFEQVQSAPYNKRETTLKTTPYHPYLTRGKTKIRLTQFSVKPIGEISDAVPIFGTKPPLETIIVTETPNTNAFKEFLKSMFDSKEIADYLKLDAEDKETNSMNAQIVEQRKEQIVETDPQIHSFTPIDSDTYVTPIAKYKRKQKRKRKQKHDKLPVTALDYYRDKTTTESFNYNYEEVSGYMAIMNTALGLASAEKTTKRMKKINKNVEEYEDFYTETTKKHKKLEYEDYYTEKTKKQNTQEYEDDYIEPTKKLKKQKTTSFTAKIWTTSKQTRTFKRSTKITQSEEEKKLLQDIQKLTYNVNDNEYIDYDLESTREKMEDQSEQIPIQENVPESVQEPAQGSFQAPARGSSEEIFQEQVLIQGPPQVPLQESLQVPVPLQVPSQMPLQDPGQVFNEYNYEDDEGGLSIYISDNKNKSSEVFNNKDIIDTKELEIEIVAAKGQEKAEKAIDNILKDYILGAKFNDDEAKNQAAEEIDDYDGIPIGDDVQFDLDDVVLDKEEEYPTDFTGGLPIPEKK